MSLYINRNSVKTNNYNTLNHSFYEYDMEKKNNP